MSAAYTRYELCKKTIPAGTYIICVHWKYDSTTVNNFLGDVMTEGAYIDALSVTSEEPKTSAWGKQLSASTIVTFNTSTTLTVGGMVNYNTGMAVIGILTIAKLKS